MPTEALEQALRKAKWGSAEEDAIEVIAQMFGASREVVSRVLYAASIVRAIPNGHHTLRTLDHGPDLSQELRDAIQVNVMAGVARTRVRWAIDNEKPLRVYVQHLIKDPGDICNGCPVSIQCISEELSTADKCYRAGPPRGLTQIGTTSPAKPLGHQYVVEREYNGAALVWPKKLKGNTITATCLHPKGTYTIDVDKVEIV